jgi:effector-binding domain-containing protein
VFLVKKILSVIILTIILALAGGIAYLFSRPCDYQSHFMVRTTPDVVFFNIHNWNFWNRNRLNVKIEIMNETPVSKISKKVSLEDTTLIFNWNFNPINDSITEVRACVSDPDRKFHNRLTLPFKNTSFKISVRDNLIDIKSRLEFMLKTFRFEYTGYNHFKEKSCIYINLKSTPRGKAWAMISNVVGLNQFVRENNLERDGNPFLVIHDWNESKDTISFDFCFPVKRTNAVPKHPQIKFKTVESMDAIKTDFYGNYSITDITWYNLADEAKKLGYRRNNKLIEVYFNDPHSGGNELEWKAEIYMGIESVK